jgi:DNA-binding MarR family transcriptional regulator
MVALTGDAQGSSGKAQMPSNICNIIKRLGRTIHCVQFAEGLNPAQWEALRYLARANRYSRAPSALAEYLQTTKGTASQTLKSLEAKGLVRRVAVPEDRRAVRIDLTDRGHEILQRDPLRSLESCVAKMGGDIESASSVLARLASALERSNGKAFGLCSECTHFCKNEAVGADGGPHKCGLHQEPLSALDSTKICVSHRCARA